MYDIKKQLQISLASVFCLAGCSNEPGNVELAFSPSPEVIAASTDYPTRPLWGDTHLHTTNSFDAFAAGNRLGPEAALRFARGKEVEDSTGSLVQLQRPLDFLVIADHSDVIGVTADLYNTPAENLSDSRMRRWRDMMHESLEQSFLATREIIATLQSDDIPADLADPAKMAAATRRVWDNQVELVERYNEPGVFTALHGFEFSYSPNGNSLHRNVIFRDDADRASQTLPFPSAGTRGAEDLFDYMDAYEKATGGRVLSIPHNSNLSNGLYFQLTGPSGEPMTADEARRRAAREPLVEVTQYKGDSEAHPYLSRNDEFASFGVAGWENGNAPLSTVKTSDMFAGEYIREALKRGLTIEQRTGVNPYAFGMVGATDSHTSLATTDEDGFMGKMVVDRPGPKRMTRPVNPGVPETRYGWHYLAGGLAAVWATANTREAIFDAMLRREVYATTGPRISVRFFGGYRFDATIFGRDWVAEGYRGGVPMGGRMQAGNRAPSFVVQALKDPSGANLDRIQIVKGWVDPTGLAREKVFDVVWSDRQTRTIRDGRLTPVGDTVDVSKATYRNSIGAVELRTVWRDPDWYEGQNAFYYARVIEIPTPRWTAYDAVKFGIKPPKGAKLKHQERAYTSPIWVGG